MFTVAVLSQRLSAKAERRAVADRIRSQTSALAFRASTTHPPMSKSSSLASVVGTQTWKADDNTPVAQFHKKFWGKSMKDEESEWRDTQKDEWCDTREDERMDQDQDQDEATDMDDIIPGCYVLDIGIPGMAISRLWIRADYIRVFNFFQDFFDNYAKPMDRVPSAVLTGQPGIGESSCIALSA